MSSQSPQLRIVNTHPGDAALLRYARDLVDESPDLSAEVGAHLQSCEACQVRMHQVVYDVATLERQLNTSSKSQSGDPLSEATAKHKRVRIVLLMLALVLCAISLHLMYTDQNGKGILAQIQNDADYDKNRAALQHISPESGNSTQQLLVPADNSKCLTIKLNGHYDWGRLDWANFANEYWGRDAAQTHIYVPMNEVLRRLREPDLNQYKYLMIAPMLATVYERDQSSWRAISDRYYAAPQNDPGASIESMTFGQFMKSQGGRRKAVTFLFQALFNRKLKDDNFVRRCHNLLDNLGPLLPPEDNPRNILNGIDEDNIILSSSGDSDDSITALCIVLWDLGIREIEFDASGIDIGRKHEQ